MAESKSAKGSASETRMLIDRYLRLNKGRQRGGKQISRFNIWNPHPINADTGRRDWEYSWSLPDRVYKKKEDFGAEVVTVAWAQKHLMKGAVGEFGPIEEDDLDKGKSCVMRSGQILLKWNPLQRELLESVAIVGQYSTENLDVAKFLASSDIEARPLDETGRVDRQRGGGRRDVGRLQAAR